jgi:hypothetical protein
VFQKLAQSFEQCFGQISWRVRRQKRFKVKARLKITLYSNIKMKSNILIAEIMAVAIRQKKFGCLELKTLSAGVFIFLYIYTVDVLLLLKYMYDIVFENFPIISAKMIKNNVFIQYISIVV